MPQARLVTRPLDPPIDFDQAIAAIVRRRGPAILDSSAYHPEYGRFCILACDPAEAITSTAGSVANPFHQIREAIRQTPPVSPSPAGTAGVGFGGGWIGLLAYEAGRSLERLPARTGWHRHVPPVWLGLYDTAAVYDQSLRRWTLVGVEWPSDSRLACRGPVKIRLDSLEAALRTPVTSVMPGISQARRFARSDFTRREYEQAVRRTIDYIAAGDIFQANLSQRFVIESPGPPEAVFLRLRRQNPSFYGAYLGLPDATLLSASPELFLTLRGRDVLTRPIKGTRRRSPDNAVNSLRKRELWNSAKDRAELAMIIDLERNDLGRVCEYGSVRVVEPAALEEHPTVLHLVGTVAGRLRRGLDVVDLLQATFPGGSITGAPKIRAMQIIDELERGPRGVYCGSIGHVGLDGSATFNIAIRTITIAGGIAEAHAGGGIVADSTPADEYDETLAKAAALLDALGASLDEPDRIVHALCDDV